MNEQVITRLRKVASDQGWSAIVVLSPENVAYATGFVVPSHPLMRWRHVACVVPVDDEPTMVVVDMETKTVADHLPNVSLHTYNEFTDDPMRLLGEVLEAGGSGSRSIGIELSYLPAGDMTRLTEYAPNVSFAPCDDGVADARTIKTAAEIDGLRHLTQLTDATILSALQSVRAGMTEMDIAAQLTRGIFERGADTFKLMIVASGERSGYPNVGPTDRVLQVGDLIRVEIFGVIAGYHAGVCRTAVVGEPTPEQERVWSVIIECRNLILREIRQGASAAAVYRLFSEVFDAAGLPRINFVGHGIGVFLHEEPYLGRYGDSELKAGMVLGVEPLVYAPGQGMQNKDMVLVTDSGCELLSDVTPVDELLRVPA